MKRNDMGDSYVLGCSTGSLRRGEPSHPRGRSRRPMLTSTPHNRHRSTRLDAEKSYAGTPTIGNARLLWFPFHSPGAGRARRSPRALLADGRAQTVAITSGYRLHAPYE